MKYEVVAASANPDEAKVEAIDHDSEGEIYMVEFSGPRAHARAQEYATWKNSLPLVTDRVQGVDCPDCEDGTQHRHL
jgi:hypothetical protein